MQKYLEYKDDKSHKFWQIEVEESEFTISFGSLGTEGERKVSFFQIMKGLWLMQKK